jgi:hypothetical protein
MFLQDKLIRLLEAGCARNEQGRRNTEAIGDGTYKQQPPSNMRFAWLSEKYRNRKQVSQETKHATPTLITVQKSLYTKKHQRNSPARH